MDSSTTRAMKPVFFSDQIKSLENSVMQQQNISSFELMKKAGEAVFSYLERFNNLLIITGPGNNAGDGFVIAKLALEANKKVTVLCLSDPQDLPSDARQAAIEFSQAGGKVHGSLHKPLPECQFDCLVDAIFGSGLNREISGGFAKTIKQLNRMKAFKVAIDIPSGLDADTGQILGVAFRADVTVGIICHKAGYHTLNGKDCVGQLFVEKLGWKDDKNHSKTHLLNQNILQNTCLKRLENSHKGSFGSVTIIAGSSGVLGAALLAGRSALVSGCGLVEIVSSEQQLASLSLQCPELLTASSLKNSRLIHKATAIAVGPGLGTNANSKQIFEDSLKLNKPSVIDADGLNLLAENFTSKAQSSQFKLPADCVLTPHPKEAARLLDCKTHDVQSNRIKAANDLATKYNSVIVLKGSGTLVCNPQGDICINPYGYSGMATAGTGDVLTGMIVSLMAQNLTAFEAAKTAVVWHAIAAESAKKGNCLIASDIINHLAESLRPPP